MTEKVSGMEKSSVPEVHKLGRSAPENAKPTSVMVTLLFEVWSSIL